MQLSQNLKQIRKKWRLNRDEFASIFGIAPGTMLTYENGRSEPKVKFLLRLYEVTGIPFIEICTRPLDDAEIPESPGTFTLAEAKKGNSVPLTQDPLYNNHMMVKKVRDMEGEMAELRKKITDIEKEKGK